MRKKKETIVIEYPVYDEGDPQLEKIILGPAWANEWVKTGKATKAEVYNYLSRSRVLQNEAHNSNKIKGCGL